MIFPICVRASDGGRIIGDIIGIIIEGAKAERQKKAYNSWVQQDSYVIECLRRVHGIEPNDLVQKGITASDARVQPYIRNCLELKRQAAARAEEEARRRDQAAREELDRQRAAQEQMELEERREAEAAEARRTAEREAHAKDLRDRFPAAWVPKILAGEIELGWTREAVMASLGEPRSRVRTPDGTEMWTYQTMKVVFTNGKVTYFGT
jgi:hypothetical protein